MSENAENGLRGWRVLVIGLATSGVSAARYCAERGARVVAVDEKAMPDRPELRVLEAAGVEVSTGSALPPSSDFDLVVPSPGVPRARYERGARRVWGDVELAARALRVPLVAVTGTNGKSTTVVLIERMLRAAGWRARAAGNIGVPALDLVSEALDAAVLEVSSFQLETVDRFRPKVAVILNASPDHIDRHGSFEDYVRAKARIFARQEPGDVTVLNVDDPVVRELARETRGRVLPVSRLTPQPEGVAWDSGRALLCRGGERLAVPLDALDAAGLPGVHNLENVLAALAAVWALGADPIAASKALLEFQALPHRHREVARAAGVRFVDDSKATNTGAAVRALESYTGRALWIAGGRAKGADLGGLADAAVANARAAFLIGEAAPALALALAGRIPTRFCESIEEAVQRAADAAAGGDVVLLAPGCASFDQFRNFEERGDRFAAAARAWAAARTGSGS